METSFSTKLINMRSAGQEYRNIWQDEPICMEEDNIRENAQNMIDGSYEEYDQDENDELIAAFLEGTKMQSGIQELD